MSHHCRLLSLRSQQIKKLTVVALLSLLATSRGLPSSAPEGPSEFGQYPVCDVAFESTICFFNEQHVLLPDAQPYGIVGHYKFDMIHPLDSSGLKNHAFGQFIPAASHDGTGTSAYFRKNFIIIPNSASLESPNYSFSFWLFRMQDEDSKRFASATKDMETWCTILQKGFSSSGPTKTLDATPGVYINPFDGHLKVVFSTLGNDESLGEFFVSNSRILDHRWYHVAVVRNVNRSRLYVNGIFDSTMQTTSIDRVNKGPVYVGGAPWTNAVCDAPILIDELRIYAVPIGRDQIQAEAASSLYGIDPSSLFLSCVGCSKIQAEEGCPSDFHLCTKLDLLLGGYGALRQIGLIDKTSSNVFVGEPTQQETLFSDYSSVSRNLDKGIGLCCRD